ncbi:hypothetical protein LTR28_003275, partial [Elasticomyces elasticus]
LESGNGDNMVTSGEHNPSYELEQQLQLEMLNHDRAADIEWNDDGTTDEYETDEGEGFSEAEESLGHKD